MFIRDLDSGMFREFWSRCRSVEILISRSHFDRPRFVFSQFFFPFIECVSGIFTSLNYQWWFGYKLKSILCITHIKSVQKCPGNNHLDDFTKVQYKSLIHIVLSQEINISTLHGRLLTHTHSCTDSDYNYNSLNWIVSTHSPFSTSAEQKVSEIEILLKWIIFKQRQKNVHLRATTVKKERRGIERE